MSDSRCSGRAVILLAFLPVVVAAQKIQENVVPLKNWATPLYWQPNQSEKEALPQRGAPQLVFSANAVSTTALTFVAITPCRLVDTRGAAAGFNGIDPFAGPSIAAKGTLTIPVQSPTEASINTTPAPCGVIPSIAQAYSFNLTVVPHAGGAVDYVSLWPSGGTQPFVATLNDPQGAIVANAAIIPAGATTSPVYGGVSVYNDGPAITDVVIDMNGYFAAPTDVTGNTAIGAGTLTSNTTGSQNTASGSSALSANTTGSQNTASGSSALSANTTGNDNTAVGYGALNANSTGSDNTASGAGALYSNTTGSGNTASGQTALEDNTTGSGNTASGQAALARNTTGSNNTADGQNALNNNTSGSYNTADGQNALAASTTGSDNTAAGQNALYSNTIGSYNTASGAFALATNTTGSDNTADGQNALAANTTGGGDTASGAEALYSNTTGGGNTAIGDSALLNNLTGSNNIALGNGAASLVLGSNNIHIGNGGLESDSGVIRIGIEGIQTSTFIAGVSGETASSGVEVYINSNGQLGTKTSSRRFKEQITDMGDRSSKLFQLRPVNFFYKPEYDDGSHLLQYGLIAEEVAKVYPEMVVYDKDGQLLTVRYQMLAPMLLNEVQKQAEQIRSLEDRLAALEAAPSTGSR